MIISIISFTDRGHALSARVTRCLPEHCVTQYGRADGLVPYESLQSFARRAMAGDDAILFIGAAGIAVRAIAPFVRSKDCDPAVLVLDENGKFVISLLSGHLGGANRLAQQLADSLDARSVITTATDGRGIFAADSWAAENNCRVRNIREIRSISSALLRGEAVGFQSDFPVCGVLPDGVKAEAYTENGILLSIFEREENPFVHTLQLVPCIVHVGVGCRRGTEPQNLRRWAEKILQRQDICACAVRSVASIALKADEPAVLELAQAWGVLAQFYTAQELEAVPGDFPPSAFVREITGTDNVCQRAAACAAKNGRCLLSKTAQDGMTISLYQEDWRAAF